MFLLEYAVILFRKQSRKGGERGRTRSAGRGGRGGDLALAGPLQSHCKYEEEASNGDSNGVTVVVESREEAEAGVEAGCGEDYITVDRYLHHLVVY